jgi:hypothetical protein
MKRTVDGDYFPTFRALGIGLLRLGERLRRRAKPIVIRTAKVLVVLLIVLAVADAIATFVTGRMLAADKVALRARGELPSITELAGPNIPDAENAALVYAEAFKLLPSQSVVDSPDYEQLLLFADAEKRKADPKSWERARILVRKYEKALLIAERAASMERCRFPVKWEDGFSATYPHYSRLRLLAQLANASGLVAARDGGMDDAVRWMALSLRMSEAIENEPILIGVLVRKAIINITSRNLQEVLRYGGLDNEQTSRLSSLLAESDLRQDYLRAIQGERATGLIAFEQIREDPRLFFESVDLEGGPIIPRLTVTVLKPLLYSDERFYLRHMGKVIADAKLPITVSRGDGPEDDLEGVHLWQAPVSSLLLPVFSRAKTAVYESLAETRICRIGLDLEAYRHRHGEYPDSLARLSFSDTEMLEDPFGGKSFIYKRQAKGFILYSVGPDMKDDGGRPVSDEQGQDSAKGDIVWRVSR